jgi:MSHA biogenesis protein MshI
MRWPWQTRTQAGRLAVMSEADRFSFALADESGRLRAAAVIAGPLEPAELARQIRALHLPGQDVLAVLPLADAQLLPVEAPAVKPEELKAAARWRIKDLVDTRLDELTIDVMHVGDERPRPNRQVFVAEARTERIRETIDRTRAAGLDVSVVDMAETTQRNLQCALAEAAGQSARATAALVRHGSQCLLTLCAGGELFYARRLEWEDLPTMAPQPAPLAAAEAPLESMDFVDYGAESEGGDHDGSAPRLAVELQRSMDVWERSWPDLPLASVWVQLGDDSVTWAALMRNALGRPVDVLDTERLFPGLNALVPSPAERQALLPVLGALLRTETRRI